MAYLCGLASDISNILIVELGINIVKQFYGRNNNTILDKIVSHCLWTYYAKNFPTCNF